MITQQSGFVDQGNEGELGLGPMEPVQEAEAPEAPAKEEGGSFWDKANNILQIIDKGADTVGRVLTTAQQPKTFGPVEEGQPAQPVKAGIPFKPILYTGGAVATVILLKKLISPAK